MGWKVLRIRSVTTSVAGPERGGTGLALVAPMPNRNAERIRRDLEERGVPESVSTALSTCMAQEASRLDPRTYEGFLKGAALTFAVHRDAKPELRATVQGLGEMQRLMGDFSDELRKLDEALEILSAYVVRMRSQSEMKDRTLH